jgi:hypothetical protein
METSGFIPVDADLQQVLWLVKDATLQYVEEHSISAATTRSNNEWVCVEDVRIGHRPCCVAQTQPTCK